MKGAETGQGMVPEGGSTSLQRPGQKSFRGGAMCLPVLGRASGSPLILGTRPLETRVKWRRLAQQHVMGVLKIEV